MELFTYLMAKNDHNTSVNKDLFSYLLGKNQSGTYTDYSGTSISVNNSKKAKMQLSLKGNTSQTGTPTPSTPIDVNVVSGDNDVVVCEKNLLNPIGETISKNSVTLTNNGDGTFTANGTASAGTDFSLTNLTTSPITLEANRQYTQTLEIISGTFGGSIVPAFKNSGGTISYNYFNCNANSRTDSKTTTEKMTAHSYNLYLTSGTSITNCTFRVQLEKGTSTSYQQYSIQKYPVYLPLLSKNIFNKDTAVRYKWLNSDGSYVNSADANLVSDWIKVKSGTQYIFSGVATTTYSIRVCSYTSKNTTTFVSTLINNDKTIRTFTANADYIRFAIGNSDTTSLNQIMLEEGTTASTYEAYNPMELCKIGTYQDYFTKNSDGEWCKYNAIGKVVLDGNTNFKTIIVSTSSGNSNMAYIYSTMLDSISTGSNGISDKLIKSGTELSTNTNSNDEMFSLSNSYAHLRFYIQKSRLSEVSVTGFKTWIGNNNIEIYYPLATPYLSLIEDNNLIEQLDNIQNAMSYKGTTNISQINDDLPFNIDAKVKVGN